MAVAAVAQTCPDVACELVVSYRVSQTLAAQTQQMAVGVEDGLVCHLHGTTAPASAVDSFEVTCVDLGRIRPGHREISWEIVGGFASGHMIQ